jgi:uncharacterized membrane protein YphA (DoxX/SURF4 family)
MHIALWVVQGLLGLLFTGVGVMKATQPIQALAANMVWASEAPPALVRFIGIAELLGGLGLILPAATRILPILTPLAAAGLTVVMVLAALFHAGRAEMAAVPVPIVLGALAALVAWGRGKRAPIAKR